MSQDSTIITVTDNQLKYWKIKIFGDESRR